MLKDEQREGQPSSPTPSFPLTYDKYLKISEILELQVLLSSPSAHDELLFIIVQQVQELWFKQILHEMRSVIDLVQRDALLPAVELMGRINHIARAVAVEVALLETMPPQEFQRFRYVLSPASGFESEQFRELELASGLAEPVFIKMIEKHMDLDALRARWPVTLHDAFLSQLAKVREDPVAAVAEVYCNASDHMPLYLLAEALSEYEVLFSEWRFRHIKLVERTIGGHSTGTGGTEGAGYLGKTMGYRFFPELWEARNRITAAGPPAAK
jgi:tryptophan 2,3-dioxygenase